ncbi:major facilitator superfamily protein [Natrialba chahannaoensis JCM 10990]|uniref:Major facilitator superfamily protein n=1 Tax=Natrialba chahannaoensis JCM 10990 TaxID=1227492 RepID=M0B1F3_9EURY|nr:major facilitator superfamily protein [Natrialba chahannaoensis JCM 10990]
MMRWRYRETVLAPCTLAFFVTMYGRIATSPVVPSITTLFSSVIVSLAADFFG